MAEHELGIIGCGNMAEAIVRGIVRAGLIAPGAIVATDPDAGRQGVVSALGIADGKDDNTVPAGCRRVVLAVKPQKMAEVLDGIASHVRAEATVVSIAAGINTAFIDRRLGGRGRIVRVMPNTPMLVGAGVSAIAAGPRAGEDDVRWTEKLFASCGKTVIVAEAMMDAVTAVSGSGPAYFFYLIEAMIAAGEAEGLPGATARMLAVETCAGAARLLVETGETAQALRARVTSPNGTTQRAIETMETAGVGAAIVRAVRAAAERSRELGK